MKWNLHLLYCNGHRVAQGRTFEDVAMDHSGSTLRFCHSSRPDHSVCVFELHDAQWKRASENSLYFSGYEQREDGRLSYQSVMIEPGREYAANRDPNFLYPLKVGGLSGDHNTGDGIVTSSVQLTDPSQHANYRLDHDQIVELLHRLHSYGRSNFEDWLRQHILKDQQ